MTVRSKRNGSIKTQQLVNGSLANDKLRETNLYLIMQVLLRDYADFDLVEQLDKRFGVNSVGRLVVPARKLQNSLLSGNWEDARKALVALEADPRSMDILNEHIAQEMIQNEGGASERTIQFIRTHIKDQMVCIGLTKSLLYDSKPALNRQQLFYRLLRNDSYRHRVQQLLDHALLYKSVVEDGHLPRRRRAADLESYIYSEVCLNLLSVHSPGLDGMTKLKLLCEHVSQVNEFHDTNISRALFELLVECVTTDPLETVTMLVGNPKLSQSIQREVHWTPLMTDKCAVEIKPNFAFLEEYTSRRLAVDLPNISSILELGLVMQSICDPFSVKVELSPANLSSYTPSESFPLMPQVFYDLKHTAWALARSPNSRNFAVGVAPYGAIQVFTRETYGDTNGNATNGATSDANGDTNGGEWRPSVSVAQEKAAERIAIDDNGRTIASRCGIITGFETEPEVAIKNFGSRPEGHSYGDVLWHPKNPNLFFAARDSEPVLHLYDFVSTKEVAKWRLSRSPLLMALSGDHIVLLTAKVVDYRQFLIFVNYKTAEISEFELPELENEEEVYNSVACSQYDPRTIVLLASPRYILIVDKFGERKPRCIIGARIRHYMMRVRLSGPMDKYIMTTCESKYATKALIYDRFTGETVTTLQGMRDLSNDIQWIPPCSPEAFPEILVASDDKSVIIYGRQD